MLTNFVTIVILNHTYYLVLITCFFTEKLDQLKLNMA